MFRMKSLKFKVISSLIAAALVIPAAAVHAEGTDNTTNNLGSGLVKQQQNLQTREQRLQFRTAMIQKKDIIKKDHETNQNLRKTIADKRTTVKTTIKDIKQSKKQLTSDDLNKIQAQIEIIKTDKSTLEASNGTMKQSFQQFKTDAQSKNYTDALAQLDKIITIQNTRTTGLNKLSSDLNTLISLLQTAEANGTNASGTTSPETTPATPNTGA